MDEEANNFQIEKFSLRLSLSFCLFFAIFSLASLVKVLLIKKGVMTKLGECVPLCHHGVIILNSMLLPSYHKQ